MLRRIRELFNDVLRQADLLLLALCGGASLFGVLMVSSATRYMHTNRLVLVQAAALVIGVLLYLLVSQIDVGELVKYWKWIFLVGIGFILLLATPLGIDGGTGNRAWLDFPFLPVKVQPAEIVKITFILVLAKQLAWLKENRNLKSVTSVAMLAVHFGVIFVLYYKISGDMGSALVFLFIFACMCFVASARKVSRLTERAISSKAVISREKMRTSLPCCASWSASCIQKAVLPREEMAPRT